jgi:hypothetical protein
MYLCIGWWLGFVLFVLLLHWRMTPPRGDNWAGCTGMAIALCIFLAREGLWTLLYGALLCGVGGGAGFALAQFLKLLEIQTGLATNWHSVLEQTYGFINGLGIAALILFLSGRTPRLIERNTGRSFEMVGILFVLIAITYLNLEKNVETWIKAGAVPAEFCHFSARFWFNLAYGLAAAAITFIFFGAGTNLCRCSAPTRWVARSFSIWFSSGGWSPETSNGLWCSSCRSA